LSELIFLSAFTWRKREDQQDKYRCLYTRKTSTTHGWNV